MCPILFSPICSKTGGFEKWTPFTLLLTKVKATPMVLDVTEDEMLAPLTLSESQLADLTFLSSWEKLKKPGEQKPIKTGRGIETSAEYTAPELVEKAD